jgi:hypothetical protein
VAADSGSNPPSQLNGSAAPESAEAVPAEAMAAAKPSPTARAFTILFLSIANPEAEKKVCLRY